MGTTDLSEPSTIIERYAIFRFIFRAGEFSPFRQIYALAWRILSIMAAQIPFRYSNEITKDFIWGNVRYAFIATFIICFGGSEIIAFLNSSLHSFNRGEISFAYDTVNIINYAIICPLYVSFGLSLWLSISHIYNSNAIQNIANHFGVGLLNHDTEFSGMRSRDYFYYLL